MKGIVTSVDEFHTLDRTLASFERATGSRLHRATDPNNQKCSILALGKWARWTQSDSLESNVAEYEMERALS